MYGQRPIGRAENASGHWESGQVLSIRGDTRDKVCLYWRTYLNAANHFISAYGAYTANNNQNVDVKALTQILQKSSKAQMGIGDDNIWTNSDTWARLPGTFSVPICSYDVWRINYRNFGLAKRDPKDPKSSAPPCPYYPCCEPAMFPRETWVD